MFVLNIEGILRKIYIVVFKYRGIGSYIERVVVYVFIKFRVNWREGLRTRCSRLLFRFRGVWFVAGFRFGFGDFFGKDFGEGRSLFFLEKYECWKFIVFKGY